MTAPVEEGVVSFIAKAAKERARKNKIDRDPVLRRKEAARKLKAAMIAKKKKIKALKNRSFKQRLEDGVKKLHAPIRKVKNKLSYNPVKHAGDAIRNAVRNRAKNIIHKTVDFITR